MDKVCFKCGRLLPLVQFYPHPQMADGHLNKCKDCARRDATAHRAAHLDRVKEYDRRRRHIVHDPIPQTAAVIQVLRDELAVEGYTPREKRRATNVASRLPKQPCLVCGATKVEAHHPNYSEPKRVRWLCRPHHAQVHRKDPF